MNIPSSLINICSECNRNKVWFKSALRCKCRTIYELNSLDEFNDLWNEAQKELEMYRQGIRDSANDPHIQEEFKLWDQCVADGLNDAKNIKWTKLGPSIIPIQIQLIHPDAQIPKKATPYSAGYDVCAIEEQIVRTNEIAYHVDIHKTKPSSCVGTLVKLGFKIAIPIGYEIQIRPRSGLALKYGITCLNSPGTIDSDYRGEVGVILINHSNQEYTIKKGDRIAQMIVAKAPESEFILVNDLKTTERGEGGYGHSGK